MSYMLKKPLLNALKYHIVYEQFDVCRHMNVCSSYTTYWDLTEGISQASQLTPTVKRSQAGHQSSNLKRCLAGKKGWTVMRFRASQQCSTVMRFQVSPQRSTEEQTDYFQVCLSLRGDMKRTQIYNLIKC